MQKSKLLTNIYFTDEQIPKNLRGLVFATAKNECLGSSTIN